MKSLTFSYLACDLTDTLLMRYFRKRKLIQNLLSTKLLSLISNITMSVSTYKYKLKKKYLDRYQLTFYGYQSLFF